MSILKLTASHDTTITSGFKSDGLTRAYNANMGAADSLEIYSSYYSGSTVIEPQLSRVLIKFSTDDIVAKRASGVIPSSGSVNFILKLSNVAHSYTVPRGFSALVAPITTLWDEGYGLDQDGYSDGGYDGTSGYGATWEYATTTTPWATPGGDILTGSGYDKPFYFDTGLEDLIVDVTDIVEDQINGTIPDCGVAVLLSGSFENPAENSDFYTKKFSARSSEYFYKRPVLEARWSAINTDDRGDFYFSSPNLDGSDNENCIYFYNRVNGTLKDLPSSVVPDVEIQNSNGDSLGTWSSERISTGVYRAAVEVTGSEPDTLQDIWYSGIYTFFTGEIDAKIRTFEDSATSDEFIFNVTNLKETYSPNERPVIKIYSRKRDWSPTIYTVANKNIENYIHKNLYYKIFRIVDGYTVIDYGIDPIPYTKCSYDKSGNYFDLDMSFFEPGYAYGIKLMTCSDGIVKEFSKYFRLKVE